MSSPASPPRRTVGQALAPTGPLPVLQEASSAGEAAMPPAPAAAAASSSSTGAEPVGRGVSFEPEDWDRLKAELRRAAVISEPSRHGAAPSIQTEELGLGGGSASSFAGQKRPSIIAHALSGAFGSVLAEVVLFPVDTVKLRTQTAGPTEAMGLFGTLVTIVRERGIAGLYHGLGASLLKESIHSFNYWCWHGVIFRHLSRGDNSRTPLSQRLFLNLVIKQLNWLCTVPFEVVSSVNQLDPQSAGFIATALSLYRVGGIGYFYRGLTLSMILAINPAIMSTLITTFLRVAAQLKMLLLGQDREEARDHGAGLVGVSTAVAKFVATLATYPLIRAKVIQQTSGGLQELSPLSIWRDIVTTEGVFGLYRGVVAMSSKTVLWNAFMMAMKSTLGPKRMITPPATPLPPLRSTAWMGREPYHDDLAAEKLDQILNYMKGEARHTAVDRRVRGLESRLDDVSEEMREIKGLLKQLVTTST